MSQTVVSLPDGWLSTVEADTLCKLAAGKRVLELGAYKGRSTVALASTAAHVTSVDWHKGDPDVAKATNDACVDTFPEFLANTKAYTNITPIVKRIADAAPELRTQTFDMVWIDAGHDFENVTHDMRLALELKPAVIAVHDWGLFQVTPAITALGYAPNRVIDTIAIFHTDRLRTPSPRQLESSMIKYIVAIPFSGRYVAPEWSLSMMNLHHPRNTRHGQYATKGMKRDEARVKLVEKALAEKAEYVLFIDDDTAPPFDTITKLTMELDIADPDVMVIGGIYTTKTEPFEPLVFMDHGSGPFWKWKFGDVFPCWGIATGCMLIRTEVFRHIPKPWFRDIDSVDEVGTDIQAFGKDGKPDEFHMTDDLYFCQKVNDAGFKILAHGGVLCVHWDQKGRGHTLPDDAYPVKDAPDGALWYKQYYQKG